MPRAHAVFPNDVYKMAAIGLSSFFVGPKIIEINNSGPTTHPNTTNFYKASAQKEGGGEREELQTRATIKFNIIYEWAFFIASQLLGVMLRKRKQNAKNGFCHFGDGIKLTTTKRDNKSV